MPKVMVIEDDENMLEVLRMFLELEGFEVIQSNSKEDFESIEDILRFIQMESPELLVMDVHLNNIDGFDLLRRLKKDVTFPKVHVLMSSGVDFSDRCEREGADGFILKPYMPEELIEYIHNILKN